LLGTTFYPDTVYVHFYGPGICRKTLYVKEGSI